MPENEPTTPPTPNEPPAYTPPATQADLDRIITARLERERSKFADYDDVKSKAARLDELEAANASELEKAVKAAREEGRSEAQAKADATLVSAEARVLAATAKFRDPTDAVRFLDLSSVKVNDGAVDSAAITAQLEKLGNDKPYLLADEQPPPRTAGAARASSLRSGASGGGGSGATGKERAAAALREYRGANH